MVAEENKSRRFVILDRDGTIIVERHYLSDPSLVELIPGVAEGICRIQALGFGVVVATNQSGIKRGFFDEKRLKSIHSQMNELLKAQGAYLDGIFCCPHLPEDGCDCRKPAPGLVIRAAEELGFEADASFVIGDKPCDIELGQAVGATTLLVRTGYGRQIEAAKRAKPDFIVDDLLDATFIIENMTTQDRGKSGTLQIPVDSFPEISGAVY